MTLQRGSLVVGRVSHDHVARVQFPPPPLVSVICVSEHKEGLTKDGK